MYSTRQNKSKAFVKNHTFILLRYKNLVMRYLLIQNQGFCISKYHLTLILKQNKVNEREFNFKRK